MTAHASASPSLASPSPPADFGERKVRRSGAALFGPGVLIAVGYIDPGNWATDLAAGSQFAYALVGVVIGSSLLAILFQSMSARLGIVTGQDLAQASRDAWPRAAPVMWLAAETAIVATDLAEVMGGALALHLLFRVPLSVGVLLTGFDVAVMLLLERIGMAAVERVIATLVALVGAALAYELVLARPDAGSVVRGLLQTTRLVRDPVMLFTSVGIVGATLMPHNLYLHSALARSGNGSIDAARQELRRARTDTLVSLSGAMLLNVALVVLAARVFYRRGADDGAVDIEGAHRLLAPLLGSAAAPIVFALALLAAGQSATMTATMAGQVVMSGFMRIRWPTWARRVVTRALALVPAMVVVAKWGDRSTEGLLVVSQVLLSLQLPMAMFPLVAFAADRRRMGRLRCPRWMTWAGWIGSFLILAADAALVWTLVARAFHRGATAE